MDTADAIERFLLSRKARSLSPRTITWYYGILADFSKSFRKVPKSPDKIERYLSSLSVGDERRHGYYRALRCFYLYLERRHKYKNPVKLIDAPLRKPKYPKWLNPADIQHLLSSVSGELRAGILFLVDTGARIGELVSLSVDNIHDSQWGYYCLINGKTGQRYVPVGYETYHALMVYLPFKHKYSGWWTRKISNACRSIGLNATAHTLRHTFATLWDGELDDLKSILGHRDIRTTEIYRHLRVKRLIQEHNKFSPLKLATSYTKTML